MNNPYGPPPGPYGQPPYQQPQGAQPQYPGQNPYGHQGYGHNVAAYAAAPPMPMEAPDPDKRRRAVGLGIWTIGIVSGVVLNILFTLAEIFLSKSPGRMFSAVLTGTLFALLPLAFYLFVPMVLDRYDPEPWWCLAMAFLWGAIVATGRPPGEY